MEMCHWEQCGSRGFELNIGKCFKRHVPFLNFDKCRDHCKAWLCSDTDLKCPYTEGSAVSARISDASSKIPVRYADNGFPPQKMSLKPNLNKAKLHQQREMLFDWHELDGPPTSVNQVNQVCKAYRLTTACFAQNIPIS